MKLLHLGDLHIGRSLGEFSLIEDQRYMLSQIFDMICTYKVDALILAGDIYDRAVPSEAAVQLFDTFLCRLAQEQIATFIISGNHDSDERLNFGSRLFEKNCIYISSKYRGTLYRQTLCDEYGEVDFYLMPFVKASQVRHFFPEESIQTYDDAVRTVIAHAGVDRSKRNVMIAHQFVTGNSADPVTGGSEGLSVRSVGLVEKIGYDCFDDFDYTALGHIHAPQRVGRDTIRYAGSPLKYSLHEAKGTKSVPLITLEEKGEVRIELLPIRPLRDVRHVRGPIDRLLDKNNIVDLQDFIYVTLTDEESVDNAMSIFRQYYPNTVKLDYDNSHTKEIGEIDFSQMTGERERPFEEQISEFYDLMYGCEISEDEMKIMRDVAKEVGIIHEAD